MSLELLIMSLKSQDITLKLLFVFSQRKKIILNFEK